MGKTLRHVGTLGERQLIQHDCNLYCSDCHHHAFADIDDLVRRYGADLTLHRFWQRLRCSRCGGRSVEIRVQPRCLHYGWPKNAG